MSLLETGEELAWRSEKAWEEWLTSMLPGPWRGCDMLCVGPLGALPALLACFLFFHFFFFFGVVYMCMNVLCVGVHMQVPRLLLGIILYYSSTLFMDRGSLRPRLYGWSH